ncbi:MAG: zinc-binding dehydrogenase [Caldilineaceae bacterium]
MRKVIIAQPRQAAVVDVPNPVAKETWVVVKIHTAPMCTEYKTFLSGGPAEFLGHEAAGEVVDVAQAGEVKVGDRVVVMPQNPCGRCALCLAGEYIHCQQSHDFAAIHGSREGSATYAQYLLKEPRQLVPIPEDVSYDHAAMACCGLGPSFGAFQRIALNSLDTVLITGMGPVGLGAVINAHQRGARVIAVESHPWRAERALMLGASAVIDPIDPDALRRIFDLSGGLGVDHALDCSGVPAAHRLCIDAARRKGTVTFVGESQHDTPIQISCDMLRKGLTLHGSWHYNLKDTPRIMHLIGTLGSQLDLLISHSFPLEAVQQAFELQLTGNCAKVLLKPW